MNVTEAPSSISDAVNAQILAVSEDRIQGFQRDPLGEISRQSGVPLETVLERIHAMLDKGTIRRVRQTLLATNLAQGSLVAWEVTQDKLDAAFNFMFEQDPFSGHVVTRSTDAATPGSQYKLWTTLKVPQGYSMAKHCEFLLGKVGGQHFRLMPAKRLFALGVGHIRRRGLDVGAKADVLGEVTEVAITQLNELEWRVLTSLKREFEIDELIPDLWRARAEEAGVTLETFYKVAEDLNARKVIGRFSTFLEHVKTLADGDRVTRFNALFHWAVPAGREIEAGREVARHFCMTHAYWREGGPEFKNVNVMGVAHGTDKSLVLANKAAIDQHLATVGIPLSYTNVFWGGRSEIKPSEISPFAYRDWCKSVGFDPDAMKEKPRSRRRVETDCPSAKVPPDFVFLVSFVDENLIYQEHEGSEVVSNHAAATTDFTPTTRFQATYPVASARAPQARYGMLGFTSNMALAKTGPTMRAKLPALWATPSVAPCSWAGVRLDKSPKSGGRVRPDPTASRPTANSRNHHAAAPGPNRLANLSGVVPSAYGNIGRLMPTSSRLKAISFGSPIFFTNRPMAPPCTNAPMMPQ